jgi:hypothetical protein
VIAEPASVCVVQGVDLVRAEEEAVSGLSMQAGSPVCPVGPRCGELWRVDQRGIPSDPGAVPSSPVAAVTSNSQGRSTNHCCGSAAGPGRPHRIGWSLQAPARRAAERDEAAATAWREETWPVIKGG